MPGLLEKKLVVKMFSSLLQSQCSTESEDPSAAAQIDQGSVLGKRKKKVQGC